MKCGKKLSDYLRSKNNTYRLESDSHINNAVFKKTIKSSKNICNIAPFYTRCTKNARKHQHKNQC